MYRVPCFYLHATLNSFTPPRHARVEAGQAKRNQAASSRRRNAEAGKPFPGETAESRFADKEMPRLQRFEQIPVAKAASVLREELPG